MAEREVRAGDADRERVAESLRRHFADGRLTPEEFDERLSGAYTARTIGDLADLLADLPQDPPGYALPVPVSGSPVRRRREPPAPRQVAWRASLATYVVICSICVFVWALTGLGYFWPIWVIGPWGIVLLGGWFREGRH